MESNIQTHPSLRCQAHWQNAQSQRVDQILPKSLPARPTPTHGQMDNTANFKDKMIENNKGQLVTMCINHWVDSASFEGVAFNKLCSGLTGKCFEMPNAS